MRGGGEMFQKNLPISPGPRMAILEWNVSGRHRQQHHPQHPHQHRCRDWRWLLGPSRRRKQATWNVDFMAGQPMSPPVHQKFQVSKMEGFLNPIAGKAKDVFVRCNLCRSISNKKRTHWLAYTYPIYIYICMFMYTVHIHIRDIRVCCFCWGLSLEHSWTPFASPRSFRLQSTVLSTTAWPNTVPRSGTA